MSRPPGSFVHELATGLLERVGGSVAVNVATLGFGVMAVVLLAGVLRRSGAPHAELAALVLAANAHFIVAATSLADQLWAIGFVVLGIDLFQRDRPKLAGVAWALAIGCRLASSVLVVAYLVAELAVGRRDRRSVGWSAGIAFVLGVLCFVPPWLSVGRTTAFLDTAVEPTSLVGLAGRSAVKHYLFLGLPMLVILLALLPRAVASLRERRREPLVVFALLGGLGLELVFLRFPWKLSHLLPDPPLPGDRRRPRHPTRRATAPRPRRGPAAVGDRGGAVGAPQRRRPGDRRGARSRRGRRTPRVGRGVPDRPPCPLGSDRGPGL